MKIVLLTAAALSLASCSRESRPRPVTQSADRVVPGNTVEVALESWPDRYEAVGTVRARTSVVISSKVMGYVRELNARAGASLLSNVGLSEWIATTPQQYVELAVKLAGDTDTLATLRRELRPRLMASAVMDEVRYMRDLEAVYREAWRRWCAAPAER